MPSIKKADHARLLLAQTDVILLRAENERLRNALRDYNIMQRELDNARSEIERAWRAVEIEKLKYQQYQKALEVYQNLIIDNLSLQVSPPYYVADAERVDIPNCLKPLDSIEYVNRDRK